MIIFDLPTIESYEKKEYQKFRKELIRSGYIMIQFSVYVKSFNHQINLEKETRRLNNYLPSGGNIRALLITEHQWINCVFLNGEKTLNEFINNNERFNKI